MYFLYVLPKIYCMNIWFTAIVFLHELTHCDLVTPDGATNLGHHWICQWSGARQHRTIAWTYVDTSLGVYSIFPERVSQEMHKLAIHENGFKFTV